MRPPSTRMDEVIIRISHDIQKKISMAQGIGWFI